MLYKGINMKKSAFTMIELVFVIVVLGILAAVAVPRLAATRDDAAIAKGRSDVASIRSGIITERQSRLFRGDSTFITNILMDNGGLFGGVMTYPIVAQAGRGHWTGAAPTYTFSTSLGNAVFTYCPVVAPGCPVAGVFDCANSAACSALTD